MIQTLAETIIWIAEERMKQEKYQNLNSAIHSVLLEMSQILMKRMAKERAKQE